MSATLETVLELAGRVGASWVVGSRASGAGDTPPYKQTRDTTPSCVSLR